MVSAARYNAQYSFKTTRLKTFVSHLVPMLERLLKWILRVRLHVERKAVG